ncbi:MAG TPA: anti-sigma factor [Terriglobales bacterium]|nr:anti-sigma factor [Terriglobales bacterium]
MNCTEAKTLFSPYLDGVLTGAQMLGLSRHLEGCGACTENYVSLRRTQQLLGGMGRRKAPADLALKLRVAVSGEVARSKRPFMGGAWTRVENALNAFMVPVAAGLVAAVTIFGILMGSFALPLQASNSDIPININTAPQLKQAAFGLDSIHEGSLVVVAYVDAQGRVQDYRVISDPDSDSEQSRQMLPQVKNMLIFSTFHPATSMGIPTSGKAVLSFSKISVKG